MLIGVVQLYLANRVTRRLKRNSPNFWKCGQNFSQKKKIQYISIELVLNVKIHTTNHILNCSFVQKYSSKKVAKWQIFGQSGHTASQTVGSLLGSPSQQTRL